MLPATVVGSTRRPTEETHHKATDLGGVVALGSLGAVLGLHAPGVVQEEVSVVRLRVCVVVATGGRHECDVVLQPHC